MLTTAVSYTATRAGGPHPGQEVHNAVPSAPAGTVDEERLVGKLIRTAPCAQVCWHFILRMFPVHTSRADILAEQIVDSAQK